MPAWRAAGMVISRLRCADMADCGPHIGAAPLARDARSHGASSITAIPWRTHLPQLCGAGVSGGFSHGLWRAICNMCDGDSDLACPRLKRRHIGGNLSHPRSPARRALWRWSQPHVIRLPSGGARPALGCLCPRLGHLAITPSLSVCFWRRRSLRRALFRSSRARSRSAGVIRGFDGRRSSRVMVSYPCAPKLSTRQPQNPKAISKGAGAPKV